MKLFFYLMFLLGGAKNAWGYSCPVGLQENTKALAFKERLEGFVGVRGASNCQVEVTTCAKNLQPQAHFPIAEILIKNNKGREIYLPILLGAPEMKTRSLFKVFTKSLVYEHKDRNYESELGRTEYYRLEISNKNNMLDKIELGVYSTNTRLNQPNGNQSHWYICTTK